MICDKLEESDQQYLDSAWKLHLIVSLKIHWLSEPQVLNRKSSEYGRVTKSLKKKKKSTKFN